MSSACSQLRKRRWACPARCWGPWPGGLSLPALLLALFLLASSQQHFQELSQCYFFPEPRETCKVSTCRTRRRREGCAGDLCSYLWARSVRSCQGPAKGLNSHLSAAPSAMESSSCGNCPFSIVLLGDLLGVNLPFQTGSQMLLVQKTSGSPWH